MKYNIPHKDKTPEGLLKELEYDVECLGKLKSPLFLDIIKDDIEDITNILLGMGVSEKDITELLTPKRRTS